MECILSNVLIPNISHIGISDKGRIYPTFLILTFYNFFSIINIESKKGMIIIRLWHTQLISILPRQQLVAQWREISSIAGAILKNDALNHMLVNFVLDYPYDHLISYAYYIRKEMTQRGYRTMDSVWNKITSLADGKYEILSIDEVYHNKMNRFYYKVCLYNLAEKIDCGGITEEPYKDLINKELLHEYIIHNGRRAR